MHGSWDMAQATVQSLAGLPLKPSRHTGRVHVCLMVVGSQQKGAPPVHGSLAGLSGRQEASRQTGKFVAPQQHTHVFATLQKP